MSLITATLIIKEMFTQKSYSQIGYSDFQSSGLREKNGDEYARRSGYGPGITLFGTGTAVIGRYVNSMDLAQ